MIEINFNNVMRTSTEFNPMRGLFFAPVYVVARMTLTEIDFLDKQGLSKRRSKMIRSTEILETLKGVFDKIEETKAYNVVADKKGGATLAFRTIDDGESYVMSIYHVGSEVKVKTLMYSDFERETL